MNPLDTPLDRAHAYRLTRLARLLRRSLERTLQPFELSAAQFFVLMRLAESDGRIQGELVDPDLDDRANITRLVDGLVARGLVQRRRDASDRRRQRVHLTAGGTALITQLRPEIHAVREKLFGPFPADELALLDSILDRLETSLR